GFEQVAVLDEGLDFALSALASPGDAADEVRRPSGRGDALVDDLVADERDVGVLRCGDLHTRDAEALDLDVAAAVLGEDHRAVAVAGVVVEAKITLAEVVLLAGAEALGVRLEDSAFETRGARGGCVDEAA